MKCAFFILTRFNICLWPKDKRGKSTQAESWLNRRFDLFERFCLPSVKNQSMQDFEWIVLFDSDTLKTYQDKIRAYKQSFPAFSPYFVPSKAGYQFAYIFQSIVSSKVSVGDKVVTVYLDNDDALRFDYMETVKRLAMQTNVPTFISFKYGLQYFTSLNIATRIPFRTNHFISLTEVYSGESGSLKTVFGYGSHMWIDRYEGTQVVCVDNRKNAEWLEVVHETNVMNEVMLTWNTRIVRDIYRLQKDYGISVVLSRNSLGIFCSSFLVCVIKRAYKRLICRISGK